ncbi:hypothetical protein EDC04DRAFT_2571241 [Pisolithus marmoratus]|nr:hypothetical protein EDC04DRAFT_2571241 [Pisolithus marmoratus]
MSGCDSVTPLSYSFTDTPFPSPGSSFLPPPIPVAREFALLRKDGDLHQDDPVDIANTTPDDDVDAPNGVVSPIRVLTLIRSFLPRFIISLLNIPTSLLRMASFQDLPQNLTHFPSKDPTTPTPSGSASTPTSRQSIHDAHRLSTHSTTSLTSSRPAPPSPAVSRSASGRLSRSSSTARSRPPSESVTEFDGNETIDSPTTWDIKDDLDTPLPHPSSQPRSLTTHTLHLICIRDYAFPFTDVRFSGNGPHVPRPNRPRVLARKLRRRTHSSTSSTASTTTSTTSSESGDGGNGDDDDQDSWGNHNGWGTFSWGWGVPLHTSMSSHNDSSTTNPDTPSQSDLDRNFEADSDSDAEYVDVEEDFPVDSADPSFSQLSEDEDVSGNDLLPGLYRALYAFEPEGTAEMRLEEDQVVRVLGRGGGVGWAVVIKDGLKDAGLHALVPESYLEVLKLDCEGESEVDPNVEL